MKFHYWKQLLIALLFSLGIFSSQVFIRSLNVNYANVSISKSSEYTIDDDNLKGGYSTILRGNGNINGDASTVIKGDDNNIDNSSETNNIEEQNNVEKQINTEQLNENNGSGIVNCNNNNDSCVENQTTNSNINEDNTLVKEEVVLILINRALEHLKTSSTSLEQTQIDKVQKSLEKALDILQVEQSTAGTAKLSKSNLQESTQQKPGTLSPIQIQTSTSDEPIKSNFFSVILESIISKIKKIKLSPVLTLTASFVAIISTISTILLSWRKDIREARAEIRRLEAESPQIITR